VNPARFLSPGQPCTPLQAAFAVAFHLPVVSRVAVGADHMGHLAELVAAARLEVDTASVAAYRSALAGRDTVAR
jgi:pyridoxine 4-dehydrogenase